MDINIQIYLFDILTRISTILLTNLTDKTNYAIPSKFSIIYEILDVFEYIGAVHE